MAGPSDKGEQFGTPSRTIQGEWVRSKGEKAIADYFTQANIRYKYEEGIRPKKRRYGRIYASPDFYLPDFDLYVEFWGLAGVSHEYDDRIRSKASTYHENGIRFVSIFPEDLKDLDFSFKRKFRDVMGYVMPPRFQGLPSRFCAKCGTPVSPPGKFCVRCGNTIH